MNKPSGVKSALRTLQMFEAFAEAGRQLTLTEIARRLSIPRSSCLALIRTLASRGYLYQVGENSYYPTRSLLDTAETVSRNDPYILLVYPVMASLRDQTGETVILGKRQEQRVIYLLVVEANQIIRYSAHPGDFKPLHGTASGKVLLAALSPLERQALLRQSPPVPITPRTLTRVDALEKDLLTGLRRGWQYTEGENVPDVIAVAAPIYLAGEVFALVVTGPDQRMRPKVREHVKALLDACSRINPGSPVSGGKGKAKKAK